MSAQTITPVRSTAPIPFQPQLARKRDAEADAVIAYAKRVLDWPMLEAAIDQKLQDQREFVAWWDETVTPNRAHERNNRSVISLSDAEAQTGITAMQVSRWRARLEDPEKYKVDLYGAAWSRAMAAKGKDTTALKWTGDPESYTPEKYIESARLVMGGIDLDPASNALAQETVKAARWYGEDQDGLTQPWEGRVFLNPPYAYPTVAHFIDKLCREFQAGNVSAAILLTNNNTDTGWWHQAMKTSAAVCCTVGRINFYKADGSITQPTNGQTFFYLGNDVKAFVAAFSQYGIILSKL